MLEMNMSRKGCYPLDRLSTKAVDVESAVLLDPSDRLLVADEDLVLVDFDFLATVAGHCASARVTESLAGVYRQ